MTTIDDDNVHVYRTVGGNTDDQAAALKDIFTGMYTVFALNCLPSTVCPQLTRRHIHRCCLLQGAQGSVVQLDQLDEK